MIPVLCLSAVADRFPTAGCHTVHVRMNPMCGGYLCFN